MSIRRIVVGVDGSPHAAHALSWAAQLALALDAEVVAVHAVDPRLFVPVIQALGPPAPPAVDREWYDEVRDAFEKDWVSPLRAAGVHYRTRMIDGTPALALVDAAVAEDADLLVVGSRGRGGFAGLVLGSVSTHVVHHAHRPVVVVPDARD